MLRWFFATRDGQVRNEFALDSVETIDSQELAKRLSWRKGVLTFNGDPVEHVANEISRYATVSVEIADPTVRAIRIGGRFPISETEAMFEAWKPISRFGLRA